MSLFQESYDVLKAATPVFQSRNCLQLAVTLNAGGSATQLPHGSMAHSAQASV